MTAQRATYYNKTSGYFNFPTNGIYVFHISVGLVASQSVCISLLTQTSPPTSITNLNNTEINHGNFDTTSVDYIGTVAANTPFYFNVQSGTAGSNLLRQTSWSAFLLDSIMFPLIAFCATPAVNIGNTIGKIDFTGTIVNTGNAWNGTSDTFTAPQNGIFVFCIKGGVYNDISEIFMYVNYNKTFRVKAYQKPGYYQSGKTVALPLAANDTVYLSALNLYGSLTSFGGFLYEPISGRKVIWSVSQTNIQSGAKNPFPYNVIFLNEGNGWNSATNKFVVPYAGVYQLHLSIGLRYIEKSDYRLQWNGVDYASIFNLQGGTYGETRSRSIMIDALVGDTFHITLAASCTSHEGYYGETSFTGFLVSP